MIRAVLLLVGTTDDCSQYFPSAYAFYSGISINPNIASEAVISFIESKCQHFDMMGGGCELIMNLSLPRLGVQVHTGICVHEFGQCFFEKRHQKDIIDRLK